VKSNFYKHWPFHDKKNLQNQKLLRHQAMKAISFKPINEDQSFWHSIPFSPNLKAV